MWDPDRLSHEGLLRAEYRGPFPYDSQYPEQCRFCNKKLVWYLTPKGKVQPFNAESFVPHHGECPEFLAHRKAVKDVAKQSPV